MIGFWTGAGARRIGTVLRRDNRSGSMRMWPARGPRSRPQLGVETRCTDEVGCARWVRAAPSRATLNYSLSGRARNEIPHPVSNPVITEDCVSHCTYRPLSGNGAVFDVETFFLTRFLLQHLQTHLPWFERSPVQSEKRISVDEPSHGIEDDRIAQPPSESGGVHGVAGQRVGEPDTLAGLARSASRRGEREHDDRDAPQLTAKGATHCGAMHAL